MTDDPGPTELNAAWLARDLQTRALDPERKRQAYQRLFASPLGRFVLADILTDAGVFDPHEPADALTPDARSWLAGRSAEALNIADLAGFSAHSLVVALMTQHLEGQNHEHAHPDGDDGFETAKPLTPD